MSTRILADRAPTAQVPPECAAKYEPAAEPEPGVGGVVVGWRAGKVRVLFRRADGAQLADDIMTPGEARAHAQLWPSDETFAWFATWLNQAADAAEALERGEHLDVPGSRRIRLGDDSRWCGVSPEKTSSGLDGAR